MTLTRTAFLALTAFAAGIARADSAPLWGPHIDIEAKPGSKRFVHAKTPRMEIF